MKVKVTEKQVIITERDQVNEGEYGINQCEFTLPESFQGLSVTAIFNGIPVPLNDGKCLIPSLEEGNCVLGVYAYSQTLGETEIMYSPKPDEFRVENGSFTGDVSEEIIPKVFDYETYCRMLQVYWREIINSNTLPEYTEDATENQYYSAKVLNEMYRSIMNGIEEVSALIGGAEE